MGKLNKHRSVGRHCTPLEVGHNIQLQDLLAMVL